MNLKPTIRTAALAVVAALALSSTATAPAFSAGTVPTDRTLNLVMGAPPSNLAIGNFSGGDAIIVDSIYDTIFSLGINGEILPNIAQSWAYTKKNTVLTLNIRKGMKFTNGEVLDAAAVVASLEVARKGPSASAGLSAISAVKAKGTNMVVLTLSKQDAALLNTLTGAQGAVGAPSTLTSETSKLWPVGSGPYILSKDESVVGSKYVLQRNPANWNVKKYPFKTVIENIIADPTAAQNALRSGQVDVLQSAGTAAVVATFPTSTFSWGENRPMAIGTLWLADRDGTVVPALKQVKVRQAINLAFDRVSITKLLLGAGTGPTNQVFNPTGKIYSKQLFASQAYNLTKAKALMAQAGYASGFEVSMPSSVYTTNMESTITQSLADIGIKVKWEPVPFQNLFQVLLGKKYGMFFMYNGFSSNPAVDAKSSISGLFNPFASTSATLDKLFTNANAAPPASANAAWGAINKFYVDNAWFAPLFYSNGFWVANKRVKYTPPIQYGVNLLPFTPVA